MEEVGGGGGRGLGGRARGVEKVEGWVRDIEEVPRR